MLTTTSILDIITSELKELDALLEDIEPVTANDTFADVELDSLLLARLIIALEGRCGVDPFSEEHDIADMHTFGDLARAYETAAARIEEAA